LEKSEGHASDDWRVFWCLEISKIQFGQRKKNMNESVQPEIHRVPVKKSPSSAEN
jgi:hypothetical protein